MSTPATGLGVLLAVCWQVGLGAAIPFVIVPLVSRIVSHSSILAALAALALRLVLRQPTPFS